MTKNGSGGFQAWLQNGRLATVVWGIIFMTYVGFRLAKVDAPELTNAFVTMTGIWVGNLGISQGKRSAKTEARAIRTEEKVDQLKEVAIKQHPDSATELEND
jgi:hypothetical protein